MSGVDWESHLRAALLADAGLSALVGQSVDWDARPQGDSLPGIALYLVSDARPRHMKGPTGFRESRVQADCFAADGAAVRAVREALIAAMEAMCHTLHGTGSAAVRFNRIAVDGASSGVERTNTATTHRQRVDFLIWHD